MNRKKGNPKKSIREWWLENSSLYSSYGDAIQACRSALNIASKASIYRVVGKLRRKGADVLIKNNQEGKINNVGLSEQELRSKHDALYKLEQAVKTLTLGKFIPEPEFRATVSIDPSKFRSKSDLPQFDQYKGKVQGVTYWGHPKDIKKLKDEGVLS
jgi:hypothetical protein